MESPTRSGGRMKRKLSNDQERDDEANRPTAGMKRPRDGSLERPPSLRDAPGALDADSGSSAGSPVSLRAKDNEPHAKSHATEVGKTGDETTSGIPQEVAAPPVHEAEDQNAASEATAEGAKNEKEAVVVNDTSIKHDEHTPMDTAPVASGRNPDAATSSVSSPSKTGKPSAPTVEEEKSATKPFVNGFAAWKQGGLGKFTPYSFGASPTSPPSAFGGAGVTALGSTSTHAFESGSSTSVFTSPPMSPPPSTDINPLAGKISTTSKNGFEGFAARNPLNFLAKSPMGENIDTLPKINAFKGFAPRSFGATSGLPPSGGSNSIFGQPNASPFYDSSVTPHENVLPSALSPPADPFSYVPEKEADVFGRKREGTPQPEPTLKGDRIVGEGEEDEDTIVKGRAALFYKVKDNPFQKRGAGWVKLNVNRYDGRARLIMRLDGTLRVAMNEGLYRDQSFIPDNGGQIIRFGVIDSDGEQTHYALKLGNTESGQNFLDHIHNVLPRQASKFSATAAVTSKDAHADLPTKNGTKVATEAANVSQPDAEAPVEDSSSSEADEGGQEEEDKEDEDEEGEPSTEPTKPSADDSDEDSAGASGSDDVAEESDKADAAEEDKPDAGDEDNDSSEGRDKPEADVAGSEDAVLQDKAATSHSRRASSPKRKHDEIEDPDELVEKEAVTKEMKRMRVNEPDRSDAAAQAVKLVTPTDELTEEKEVEDATAQQEEVADKTTTDTAKDKVEAGDKASA